MMRHALRSFASALGLQGSALCWALAALLCLALSPAVSPAHAAAYRVDTVAGGLEHPWSLAFLPDGRLLVTERPGRLRLIEPGANGRLVLRAAPVAGVPAVLARGQAGLFDVLLHPGFASNGWLYLSFAHGTPQANHLRVVRARFDGTQLLDVQPVFTSSRPRPTPSTSAGAWPGCPMARWCWAWATATSNAPTRSACTPTWASCCASRPTAACRADNPFVQRADARPEIWSLGHRNPQGLVVVGGVLYEHEHGSRGGDELNRITPGANYGWPVTTSGVDYTYARITPYRSLPGIAPPLLEWTPSVAPAGMAWYDSALFPAWRGSLMVATLKERSVRRVPMPGGIPATQELLFQELGERLRDVRVGPEGALYLLTDNPQGRVLRVMPK